MFKKILLIFIMFFSLFFYYSVLAIVNQNMTNFNHLSQEQKKTINIASQTKYKVNAFKVGKDGKIGNVVAKGVLNDGKNGPITKMANGMKPSTPAPKTLPTSTTSLTNPEKDISKAKFMITVGDISPGMKNKGKTAKESAKNVLQTIIDNLMIAFGVLALLVMTIGGGYMIMYHGEDELLSKGKAIFSAGLIAMVVALSAGILVKLVAYLIY